jgi:hypothetical protein
MFSLEYLTDQNGQPKAVVIPIALWQQIFPQADQPADAEEMVQAIEDYCLYQAMTEAAQTPLLDRDAALAYLEEPSA